MLPHAKVATRSGETDLNRARAVCSEIRARSDRTAEDIETLSASSVSSARLEDRSWNCKHANNYLSRVALSAERGFATTKAIFRHRRGRSDNRISPEAGSALIIGITSFRMS